MKKICLVDSTLPINTRNQKIIDSLINYYNKDSVNLITWNRDNRDYIVGKNEFIFKKKASYGSKFKKFFHLFSYKQYVNKIIKKQKFDIIFVSHWDMLLIVKKSIKNQIIIYENLDIPTSENFVILKLLQFFEKKSLKKVNGIIFASRFFVPLYNFFEGKKLVLENKSNILPIVNNKIINNPDVVKIAFLGIVRYQEILKNLIIAIQNIPKIELTIFGEGPDLELLIDFSKKYNKVFFEGRYEQADLNSIYNDSDLIWAVYPNKDYNVKYAISNKFHESFVFFKPVIYSSKTKLGEYVLANKIGYTVDPYSIGDIINLLKNIIKSPDELNKISENLIEMSKIETNWDQDFNYIIRYINSF